MTTSPRPRGYALIIVLLILALIALAVGVVFSSLQASATTTGNLLKRRQAFYACDGVVRTLTKLAATHLQSGDPTNAAIGDALCSAGGGGCHYGVDDIVLDNADPLPLVRPAGFTIKNLRVRSLARQPCIADVECGAGAVCEQPAGVCRGLAPLPDGPFKGMEARSDTLMLRVVAESVANGFECTTEQHVTLGEIGMFQFFLFSDVGYTDWQPRDRTIIDARVHANGDLCVGGPATGTLTIAQATAAGDINALRSSHCRTCESCGSFNARANVEVANKAAPDFDQNDDGNRNDPEPADVSSLTKSDRDAPSTSAWDSHALLRWGGQLMDRAHGVRALKLPVLGATAAPAGKDAAGGTLPNTTTMRYLIDPPTGGDDATLRAQRLATKASLRIINGVWYVNNGTFPGTPIWSDHPGRASTTSDDGVPAGIAVGQEDLFGGGGRPRKYSYYAARTDGADAELVVDDGDRAVVSYGGLFRDGGSTSYPLWRPGVRCANGDMRDATQDQANLCGTGSNVDVEDLVLEATRTGFRNALIERSAGGFSQGHDTAANVLPMNFDVGALQDALADGGTSELGGRLAALGHTFNGIVWITSTWPGQSAALGLREGANDADAAQPASSAHAQRELPAPLCSSSLAGGRYGDDPGRFRVPACAAWTAAASPRFASAPNALRIINARNVNRNGSLPHVPSTANLPSVPGGELPSGLTIATNLPVYVLGDVNLSSNAQDGGAPWVPVLVAGDVVYALSNGWDDARSQWHESSDCRAIGGSFSCTAPAVATWPRPASSTTYHMAVLTGATPTAPTLLDNPAARYSGGVEGALRTLEDWGGTDLMRLRGSIVLSHHAVLDALPPQYVDGVSAAPVQSWRFDAHLAHVDDQPPGAPVFGVAAVRQWRR